MGVVAGLMGAVLLLFLLRLLLTFRVQRNEARGKLESGTRASAGDGAPDVARVKYKGLDLAGRTSESSEDLLRAISSWGVVESAEGPRRPDDEPKKSDEAGPTEASGSSPPAGSGR